MEEAELFMAAEFFISGIEQEWKKFYFFFNSSSGFLVPISP